MSGGFLIMVWNLVTITAMRYPVTGLILRELKIVYPTYADMPNNEITLTDFNTILILIIFRVFAHGGIPIRCNGISVFKVEVIFMALNSLESDF
jgi:hypothetical protein